MDYSGGECKGDVAVASRLLSAFQKRLSFRGRNVGRTVSHCKRRAKAFASQHNYLEKCSTPILTSSVWNICYQKSANVNRGPVA